MSAEELVGEIEARHLIQPAELGPVRCEPGDGDGECDLVYTEISMWEPLVDGRRLLGSDGLVHTDSAYLDLALRQVENSINWREAGQRLADLHFVAHNEAAVLPLWQMVNYFAHHRRIRNVEEQPMVLYHNVERWEVTPRLSQE